MERGDLACPQDDLVTYEACLLFQGALGVWSDLGLTDQCPNLPGSPAPTDGEPSGFDSQESTPAVARRAVDSPCFGYLYAIGVANTVPILSSTANRNFQLSADEDFTKPGSDAEVCLQVRHGSCGNQTAVGLGLFKRAGFTARPVEFYYTLDGQRFSHIVPEVFLDGEWRMVDTTYGAYWAQSKGGVPFALRTTDGIINAAVAPPTWNEALLPYGVYGAVGDRDPFAYLANDPQLVRGRVGTITITVEVPSDEERFVHLPNFVGDNSPDGLLQGLDYRFTGATDTISTITVAVTGAAIAGDAPTSLCIDDVCQPYERELHSYTFAAEDPERLYLQTDADVAYLVLDSVTWA